MRERLAHNLRVGLVAGGMVLWSTALVNFPAETMAITFIVGGWLVLDSIIA